MPPPASGARALLSSVAHRLRRVSPLAIMGRRPCLCMLAWLVRADVKKHGQHSRPARAHPPVAGCTPLSLMERWQAVLEAEWTEAFGCPPDERQRLLLPTQAVPLLAIALVIPDMRLTPPEKGWRVKNHPAAVAIDALTLASRAPSIVYEVTALVRVRDRIRVGPYLKSLTLTRSTARRHHRPTAWRTLKPQGAHGRSGGSAQTTTRGRATSRPTTAPSASTAAASGRARALARARASEGSGTTAQREAPNGTRSGCGCWRWRRTEVTCSTRRVRASCAGSSALGFGLG